MFYVLLNIYTKITPKLEETTSLFSPAVEEHGRSQKVSFQGDYIIKTFSGDNVYVQLGFGGSKTQASLGSKNSIPSENFRIDIRFQITPSEIPGDGIDFIFSKEELETLEFNKPTRDNIIIQINTQGKKPVIKMIIRGHEQIVSLKNIFYGGVSSLRIENVNDNLKTYISHKDQDYKLLFSALNSRITKNMYYGIVVGNSNGYNISRIFGIRTNLLENISDGVFVERKSSKLVWLVFVLVAIGIGYLLWSKQGKSPAMRQ